MSASAKSSTKPFKSIPLTTPVTFGEETISAIDLRRPTGLDYRQVGSASNNYDLCLRFAAQLSGLPDDVFDKMDGVDDIPQIVEVVSGFLTSSLKTGKTSSGI